MKGKPKNRPESAPQDHSKVATRVEEPANRGTQVKEGPKIGLAPTVAKGKTLYPAERHGCEEEGELQALRAAGEDEKPSLLATAKGQESDKKPYSPEAQSLKEAPPRGQKQSES